MPSFCIHVTTVPADCGGLFPQVRLIQSQPGVLQLGCSFFFCSGELAQPLGQEKALPLVIASLETMSEWKPVACRSHGEAPLRQLISLKLELGFVLCSHMQGRFSKYQSSHHMDRLHWGKTFPYKSHCCHTSSPSAILPVRFSLNLSPVTVGKRHPQPGGVREVGWNILDLKDNGLIALLVPGSMPTLLLLWNQLSALAFKPVTSEPQEDTYISDQFWELHMLVACLEQDGHSHMFKSFPDPEDLRQTDIII